MSNKGYVEIHMFYCKNAIECNASGVASSGPGDIQWHRMSFMASEITDSPTIHSTACLGNIKENIKGPYCGVHLEGNPPVTLPVIQKACRCNLYSKTMMN